MSRISPEKEISYISKVIEKNIFYYDSCLKDKGFLSENILSQLRNLVEDVAILLNADKHSQLPIIEKALKLVTVFAQDEEKVIKQKNDILTHLDTTKKHWKIKQ